MKLFFRNPANQNSSNLESSRLPPSNHAPTGGYIPDYVLDDLEVVLGSASDGSSRVPPSKQAPTGGYVPDITFDYFKFLVSLQSKQINPLIFLIQLSNKVDRLDNAFDKNSEAIDKLTLKLLKMDPGYEADLLKLKIDFLQAKGELIKSQAKFLYAFAMLHETYFEKLANTLDILEDNLEDKKFTSLGKEKSEDFHRITKNYYADLFKPQDQSPKVEPQPAARVSLR